MPYVLVVEDDALIADYLRIELGILGHEHVGPYATVGETLAAIPLLHWIDAAIFDYNLDGELSLPIARELAVREIPYTFITGNMTQYRQPCLMHILLRNYFVSPTCTAG